MKRQTVETEASCYEKLEQHCPDCGAKGLWVEMGEGDFYFGPIYHCTACESSGHLQWQGRNVYYADEIAAIKAADRSNR